jgi:menaquinol-cytochrome c reductase iron-sulfur subunit
MNPPPPNPSSAAPVPYEATARRGFFTRLLAGLISVLLGLVPAGFGLGFFLDPLLRRRGGADGDASDGGERKDRDGFIRLDIGVSALPADGTPVEYKVLDDKSDAWNLYRDIEVGKVWLRLVGDNQVLALSSICPHLGCAVDLSNRGDFFCPCHTSSFNLDGERTNEIPPRNMDRLETRLKPETGDTIWLKYQNFRATTPEKIPLS